MHATQPHARHGTPGEAPATRTLADAESTLAATWSHAEFRYHQRRVIVAALQGRDCLVVLPTGGGKSVCYQIPALMRSGLSLVVSPFISLMQDQRGQSPYSDNL